jgi:hypothetical protein
MVGAGFDAGFVGVDAGFDAGFDGLERSKFNVRGVIMLFGKTV